MKSSRIRAKTDNATTATKLLVALTGKGEKARDRMAGVTDEGSGQQRRS
jgi:hypothetical protein